MKILSVVGARPNFMKVAPIITAIKEHNRRTSNSITNKCVGKDTEIIDHVLVHTGQHYDWAMSDSFFADLTLPKPDVHLGVGSGSHAFQTAEIMKQFEEVLLRERPDALVVVGDVNSTLACALVAAKISPDASRTPPLIAHVEAGLRSFDRCMPEEINRILTDHLSELLFVTEESGLTNLTHEGIAREMIHFVGNTMIDSLLAHLDKAESSGVLDDLGLRNSVTDAGSARRVVPYVLLTLHRPANVDSRDAFLAILEGLREAVGEYPVVFPAHPRTQKRIKEFSLESYFAFNAGQTESQPPTGTEFWGCIRVLEPLGYLDFLCLMKNAVLVVTDSGGIQEETTCLGIPCVTVRDNTERPVTVERGTNIIAGTTKEKIAGAIRLQRERRGTRSMPMKWDGEAARRIVDTLLQAYYERTSTRPSQVVQRCDSFAVAPSEPQI